MKDIVELDDEEVAPVLSPKELEEKRQREIAMEFWSDPCWATPIKKKKKK